jgi:hypothetical protein
VALNLKVGVNRRVPRPMKEQSFHLRSLSLWMQYGDVQPEKLVVGIAGQFFSRWIGIDNFSGFRIDRKYPVKRRFPIQGIDRLMVGGGENLGHG